MASGSERFERLAALVAEVVNLRQASGILYWDQQTMMPKAGAEARGNQMATLDKLAHEKFTRPEIGQLLEDLRSYEASRPHDSDEASAIRVTRREYEKATKLPPDLVERLSRAANDGFGVWLQAREARDYQVFRPALERTYGLMREVADVLGYQDHPMDPLLDQSEPGMKVAEVETLFAELRETLVPLCQAIFAKVDAVDDRPLRQRFPHDQQMAASREAARIAGFDLETRGRLDLSVHPFTSGFSPNDVRITTKVDEDFLPTSFFASLHEAGHGNYSQGVPVKFQQSLLDDGPSAGLHESQSLLWENVVGRSRAFWEFYYPSLKRVFPAQFDGVSMESVYRAVNKVQPSFIRVDADEVTYNLHVMIRFELEKAVFDGKLALKDLDEAWNAKFKDYLGLTPPDDLAGVLQDIHWTGGFGAAFAGYTIGHVSCLQLYEKTRRDIPGLEAGFARGEFAPLLGWMNRNIHAHGSKFTPQELLERATGRPLTAEPYLEYIRRKFGGIYGV